MAQAEILIVHLEPIDSTVPPFNAKATVIRRNDEPIDPNLPHPSHPIVLPGDPEWGPPDTPPETTPEHPVKLVWAWVPQVGRWVQGYMRADGASPKEDECNPPAPPNWALVWIYVLSVQRWVQGYIREDGAGPK